MSADKIRNTSGAEIQRTTVANEADTAGRTAAQSSQAENRRSDAAAMQQIRDRASVASRADGDTSPLRVSESGSRLSREVSARRTQARLNNSPAATTPTAPVPAAAQAPAPRRREAIITREGTPGTDTERVVIDAGAGDDRIQITNGRNPGEVVVNVNGERHTFTGADADILKIRAGDGNDRITVGRGVTVNLSIEGGAGNDRITGGAGHDRLEGGAGNDTIRGGGGRDYINGSTGNDRLYGGVGNDVVYGGDGADIIEGNAGDDYLEGSRGNDTIRGGAGRDAISGGLGDDNLQGEGGADVLYAGVGRDRLAGGAERDTIYAQRADDRFVAARADRVVEVALVGTPGSTALRVTGTPEFVERVNADIEMLRSSPNGRQMLAAYDRATAANGRTVEIRELPDENNGYADWPNRTVPGAPQPNLDAAGNPGTPDNAIISYNPQFYDDDLPTPITTLYHEMSHTYNIVNGTFQNTYYDPTGPGAATDPDRPVRDASGNIIQDPRINVRNLERQAVGLPNTGVAFDNDNDPSTPASNENPQALTENGLRDELGIRRRRSYRVP